MTAVGSVIGRDTRSPPTEVSRVGGFVTVAVVLVAYSNVSVSLKFSFFVGVNVVAVSAPNSLSDNPTITSPIRPTGWRRISSSLWTPTPAAGKPTA